MNGESEAHSPGNESINYRGEAELSSFISSGEQGNESGEKGGLTRKKGKMKNY
jgi:hypothetical protein